MFRVYLFFLPFAAYLGACAIYSTPRLGARMRSAVLASLLSLGLIAASLFAYFGKEEWSYFSPSEVAAAEAVYGSAPPNSLLIEGSSTYPGRSENYERFRYLSIVDEPPESSGRLMADPVAVLSRWMDNSGASASYLIITRSQKAQADAMGLLPRGALAAIEEAVLASNAFPVVYHDADATVVRRGGARTSEWEKPSAPSESLGVGEGIKAASILFFFLLAPGFGFVRWLCFGEGWLRVVVTVGVSLALDALITGGLLLSHQYTAPRAVVLLVVTSKLGLVLATRAMAPVRRTGAPADLGAPADSPS